MEEEVGKKVTRLRRRLSVEADDAKSPATPLTPSKKRGGRLAAKPQLELIDENAADISPKNTKKPVGKKVELDEKAVTPSRRSARIRSNTSLLSDTPTLEVPEDKGTPSRRSTRIKSNTSLVSETIQNVDSPRAKRSARRMSQAGSDNETPVTPARPVRRTRKNSTTNTDKTVESNAGSSEPLIKEVIEEETDKSVTPKVVTPKVESPVRKSPRLNRSNVNKETNENKENHPSANITIKEDQIEKQDNANSNNNNISISSSNLLKQLASEPQKSSLANKSTSNLEETRHERDKSKRQRTKSWTTISSTPANDTSFSSDTEFVRKKNKKKDSIVNISGSGDGILNASIKSNKGRCDNNTTDSSKIEDLNKSSTQTSDVSLTEKYFQKAPSITTQPLVYIDDSDSNSIVSEKTNKELDTEDQCVPVVQHNLNNENLKEVNLSYEPMDIDETLPTFIDNNESISLNKSPRKSSNANKSIGQTNSPKNAIYPMVNNYDDTNAKSKRKSSLISNEIITESLSPKVNRVSIDNSNNSFAKSLDTNANKDEVDTSLNSKRKSSISKDLNVSLEDKIDLSQRNDTSMQDVDLSTLTQNSNKKSNKSKLSLSQQNLEEINMSQNIDTSMQAANLSILSQGSNKKSNKSKLSINQHSNSPKKVTEENLNQSKRKSSINDDIKEDSIKINKSLNKSQRESVVSQNNDSQNTTTNANKSTLVISQIKDDSALEENVNESKDQQSITANVSKKIKDIKNISLTYSTSTPLQQKSLKKLGGINTSIITPDNKLGKKDKMAMSHQEESSDDNTSDNSEEESSHEKSKFINDEVDEASDDYESGDSRDDEEKEYEEENEFIEKGETLESEEDLSNDSDYEKGSFIVSSDEEDQDLLSGSGDDLSMSADELTMSAKSKKKYNERKAKERKKASKEMFDSRHKSKNTSESTTMNKAKKQNRLRLDSSDSESVEDIAPSKKNNRLRIDSSQDISAAKSDAEISISKKKKKKAKRLSESICEDTEMNEKEITVSNYTITDKIDPLNVQNVIKKEPKTPQKDFDISTVAVSNIEDVEEVNIDENVSIMNVNQIDPLQNTVIQDDNDDDDDDEGSISENEEITQNYDSVLSNLKSVTKVKVQDTSLNLNKKVKQPKQPLVDELNLTQLKQSKKKKMDSASSSEKKELNNSKIEKSAIANKSAVVDEDSSDSIDLKLLFPEDSNDSETSIINNKKPKDNKDNDGFIPLKRSEAKTNMLEDIDKSKSDETILNVSKKKNKRISGVTQDSTIMDGPPDENVSFFIDTTGTHETENIDTNTSIKNSSKKKKAKNSLSFTKTNEDEDSKDAPLEVSSRKQSVEHSFSNINTTNNDDDVSANNISSKKIDANTSIKNSSKKKKAKNSLSCTITNDDEDSNDAPLEVSSRKQSVEHSFSNINTTNNGDDVTANNSTKKKNKKKLNKSNNEVQDVPVMNESLKKDKKARHNTTIEEICDLHTTIMESTKKKNKKARKDSVKDLESDNLETISTDIHDTQVLDNSHTKKNRSLNSSKLIDTVEVNNAESNTTEKQSKKRKRNTSVNLTADEISTKDLGDQSLTIKEQVTKSQNKKIKIAQNNEVISSQDSTTHIDKKSNKKKNKTAETQQQHGLENEMKKNKKRKEREDDGGSKIAKISKQNSFDKLHVPRLPSDILNQLDDKAPEVPNKPKAISTASFTVENAKKRKNKPSNYLEESIYLNDSVDERKPKGVLKNPKVLPFTPTVATSDFGFTTNFSVNVISQQTRFVAKSSGVNNFKNEYLQKAIKKLGTFEKYKKHRNVKLSKF